MSGPYPDEHEFEAAPGLPEPLPAGERVLWRGAPHWAGLALRVFHARKVAIYFALLAAWRAAEAAYDGQPVSQVVTTTLIVAAVGTVAVGLLVLLAWLSARATIYTVTSKRVVMRIGVALPLTVNVPFKIIGSAWLNETADGRGDIALALSTSDRIGWMFLWPHARPWHLRSPQPLLRALPQPRAVAALLTQALAQATGGAALRPETAIGPAPTNAEPMPAAA
jgi:hypothetical protein